MGSEKTGLIRLANTRLHSEILEQRQRPPLLSPFRTPDRQAADTAEQEPVAEDSSV